MKSLKKLAAIGALMSTMNFVKAEEVTFKPTNFDGGEIESIELVNGQLMVKSNGNIAGVETPYVFVGTNTQHFAQNGFAQEGWDKADSLVHDGKNIYLTEPNNTSNVIHTVIKDNPTLNGVRNRLCRKDKEGNEFIGAILSNRDSKKVLYNGDIYTVTEDSVKNQNKESCSFTPNIPEGSTIQDLAILKTRKDPEGVVLALKDGVQTIATSRSDRNFQGQQADEIKAIDDHSKIMFRSGSKVSIYSPDGYPRVKEIEITGNDGKLVQGIKSAVVANDMIYYATAKKLGYKKIK